MGLRCFIAVEVSDGIRGAIGEVIEGLKVSGADVKWVPARNLHVTLKFLGDTEPRRAEEIQGALRRKFVSYRPFYIKIAGVGYFPPGKSPRVVWVGIEDATPLADLQRDVDAAMTELGYPAEGRPFSPHLTIGRVRSRKGITEMMKSLEDYRKIAFADLKIQGITLMKSELKPGGAEYDSLAHIPFEGGK
jgi:2'-5' RNA ligase